MKIFLLLVIFTFSFSQVLSIDELLISKSTQILSSSNVGRLNLIQKSFKSLDSNKESDEEPISIVSIIGPYYSGKSQILNSLVASSLPIGDMQRFQIGTLNSGTNGLWLLKSNLHAKGFLLEQKRIFLKKKKNVKKFNFTF
jgi:hypothetical protein